MRIGVISDTHIPIAATRLPHQIVEEFKKVDMIAHAGDHVGIQEIEQLRALCPVIKAVRGNMDSEEVKNLLPEKEVFHAGKFKIILIHGWGAPSSLVTSLESAFKNEKPDIVIFGHTHTPMNEKIGGVLYFNPGSPTDKVFSQFNSYGIIEITDKINARIVKL